jgi:hypothetical protein
MFLIKVKFCMVPVNLFFLEQRLDRASRTAEGAVGSRESQYKILSSGTKKEAGAIRESNGGSVRPNSQGAFALLSVNVSF